MTYDKSSVSNNPTFYINGVSSSFTDASPTGTLGDDSSQNFFMGNSALRDDGFHGDMSDVRVYDRNSW